MSAVIGYRTIGAAELALVVTEAWPLLGGLHQSSWLEHPARADGILLRDSDIDADEAQQLADQWPTGRLFGNSGELRWERMPNEQIQIVLTITVPSVDASAANPLIQRGYLDVRPLLSTYEERIMVWGRKTPGQGWSVERIPALSYPAAWPGPYAAVIIQHYQMEATADRPYDSAIMRYVRYDGAVRLSAEE